MNTMINHDRDYDFTYAGLRQVMDKYLVQDRSSGDIYETPQQMYMMIAATVFAKYPKNKRLTYIKKYYNAISTFKINIPTPVMAGVRTPMRQYASCVLVDVNDTLPSIFSSDMAVGYYTAQRAGIGLNMGRIRGINSKIRGGEVAHTGVVPFLKKFEATVKSCTQNGVRGGCATVHFPIWHKEIEDIIVLKNNKGSEDNRVRKLDYQNYFTKDLLKTKILLCLVHTKYLVYMKRLVQMSLIVFMRSTKRIQRFIERKLVLKLYSLTY
jgi:ribonucleoside-diphosphate reductase alpha chain